MKITEVRLKNFKRFTDLTLTGIEPEVKLVLLIGSNGSGKSSVFDAFDYLSKKRGRGVSVAEGEFSYYEKNGLPVNVRLKFSTGKELDSDETRVITEDQEVAQRLIGRSSIRIVPRIANNANPANISRNADAPPTYIDPDTRFTNDLFMYIQQIDNALRAPVFSGRSADTLKIFQDFIQPLNTSLNTIFGEDSATTIQISEFENATAYSNGKLIFRKGSSKINYDLLSHGEKQVVILLLNFIVRKQYYNDAIIFIDEMDCHLNTALQYRLMQEIVDVWIPDNAQLWTASHALGFIDYARQNLSAAIIDLNLLNFDLHQTILPQSKTSLEVYNIAIPKETLQHVLKGAKLVVVENKNDEHYNLALAKQGFLFLPASNNREVFLTIKGDKSMLGLRDRDYLRVDEISAIKQLFPNYRILELYAFENYIYHPDNLLELSPPGFDKEVYQNEILLAKNEQLLSIVSEIAVARQHYVEFKEGIKNDGDVSQLVNALKSDDFDTFYPFFNIKRYYNKQYLQAFNLQAKQLVSTDWFRKAIESVLLS